MAGLPKRLLGFLIGQDEAANALLGGSSRETISGSVGRAARAGKWWAVRLAQPFVNALMGDPKHCQNAATDEAARRAALNED